MRFLAVFSILGVVVCTQGDEGYIKNEKDGKSYRLMYQAQKWDRAIEECRKDNATLAVPRSQDEFDFIQEIVRGMSYPAVTGTDFKVVVYLGISNLEDYRVWKNIHGEDIDKTGYHTWASSEVKFSNDPHEPHCVVIDAINPGLRYWWCHRQQPYICEKEASPENPEIEQ